jgi:hypothetical protein
MRWSFLFGWPIRMTLTAMFQSTSYRTYSDRAIKIFQVTLALLAFLLGFFRFR